MVCEAGMSIMLPGFNRLCESVSPVFASVEVPLRLEAMKARLRKLEKVTNRLNEILAGPLADHSEQPPMSAQAAAVVSDTVAKAMEHYRKSVPA
jgi:hypothetical protein